MACTTILVGKDASYDGSTMVSRNEDSPSGEFTPKKFIVVKPEDQPKVYTSVQSKVKVELPEEALTCTMMPDALGTIGFWGCCGINAANVGMSATETLTTNERVLAADPLVNYQPAVGKKGDKNYQSEVIGGIGEEDMVSLVLPYIHTAREGVKRLGELLETYGTYEMNGIAFHDANEIWWLETVGGHHWLAKRVPDDSYVVMPNQLGIDSFDLADALGDQKEHMCSQDMKDFIDTYHLDLTLEDDFNPRISLGSCSDADRVYNTPRAWVVQRYLNSKTNTWDGIDADYRPESNDIPWSRVPERKITPEDIKYLLSNHYQETPYDPYKKGERQELYRPIGVNRTNVLGLTQLRSDVSEPLQGIEWIAFGSNVFNAMIPFYTHVSKTPEYLNNTDKDASTDSFYWTNRLIGALADAHFQACLPHIERYQQTLTSQARAVILATDEQVKSAKEQDVTAILEQANEKIAALAKKETQDLLNRVLYEASNQMKNGFARSDG